MNWVKKDALLSEKLIWNHKKLILLILSVVLAIFILKSSSLQKSLYNVGTLGYLGVFIAGLFFSYGFTTAPAMSILYLLGNNLNPINVAFIGAFGALISDYIIFRFVKYSLMDEIKKLSNEFKFHPHLKKGYIKFLKKIAPLIASFIIASPLPDELAASILGSIKVNDKEFLLISYISNFIGILIIALI